MTESQIAERIAEVRQGKRKPALDEKAIAFVSALAVGDANFLFISVQKESKPQYEKQRELVQHNVTIELSKCERENNLVFFQGPELIGFYFKIFDDEARRLKDGGKLNLSG